MWDVKRTDTFLKNFKKYKKDQQVINELDKKIKRLIIDPNAVGGNLSGKLYGKKSTRLTGKLRLIFMIDENTKTIYLIALDHRASVYG